MTAWWNAQPAERRQVFAVTGIACALIAASGLAIAKLVDDIFGRDGSARLDPKITDFLVEIGRPGSRRSPAL